MWGAEEVKSGRAGGSQAPRGLASVCFGPRVAVGLGPLVLWGDVCSWPGRGGERGPASLATVITTLSITNDSMSEDDVQTSL